MVRSFTDRVLGGVCGGLGKALRLNSWWVRAVFVVLTVLSVGAFAALYLLLWWTVPQESLAVRRRRRGLNLLVVFALVALVAAAWYLRDTGSLRGPTGIDLFWPGVLLVLSAVFFLRQIRA